MPSQSPKPLYQHVAHPHTPRNVNETHSAERQGFNARLAVLLTKYVGTMGCFYIFNGLAAALILAAFSFFGPASALLVALLTIVSSQWLQLVLLPGLMVGQNVLNRHSELAQDEAFHNIVRLLHEQDQHRRHLDAQDAELLAHRVLLTALQRDSALPNSPDAAADLPLPSLQRDAKGRFLPRTVKRASPSGA